MADTANREEEETGRMPLRSKQGRRPGFLTVGVTGDTAKLNLIFASIAQSVEHAAVNRGVTGSSPV